jgi:hypothetical protein
MDNVLAQVQGVSVLRIIGADADSRALLEVAEGEDPCPATAVWMKDVPDWGRCAGLRALVVFPEGGAGSPVILGLLDAPPGSEGSPGKQKKKRLHIEGEEEVVIECGKAKIALRADGRIEIRGGHLISRSSGPNKIKGATVHIN